MIKDDKCKFKGIEYNRKITPSDWRYSAALLGIKKFLDYSGGSYYIQNRDLYYNYENISNIEIYADYVEREYEDYMHHRILEKTLKKEEKSEQDINIIKEKLKANSISKKVFKGVKYENNDKEILDIIDKNRYDLIIETFRNAKTGYAKYCNTGKLLTSKGQVCRLNGYYVDTGRKTKSISFGFDNNARNFNDELEFDFIPFAFTRARESIFINNNASVGLLESANNFIKCDLGNDGDDFRSKLFYSYAEGSEYIDYDVEIILKDIDKDFFETIFIRKEAIEIFKDILKADKNEYIRKSLKRKIKVTDNYYINIMEIVTERILNLSVLDGLILNLIKDSNNDFLVAQLIRINKIIYKKIYFKEGEVNSEL